MDTKKDTGLSADASPKFTSSSVGGAPLPNIGFRPAVESPGRIQVMANADHHQGMGGSPFMIQSRGMQMAPAPVRPPSDWRIGADARMNASYDLTGKFPM